MFYNKASEDAEHDNLIIEIPIIRARGEEGVFRTQHSAAGSITRREIVQQRRLRKGIIDDVAQGFGFYH